MLGIRDILVRIRIPGSVPLIYGSGSGSNSDQTPFFIDFKDAKKLNFFIFFSHIYCPQAHHVQSKKLNFLQKFCVKMLFCRHYFSPLNTFMIKEKDPEPDPYLLTNGSRSGRPKNMRIRIRFRIQFPALILKMQIKFFSYIRIPNTVANVGFQRDVSYLLCEFIWSSFLLIVELPVLYLHISEN